MDTSNDSIILIEDESSCESISCNCKELMAAISKRHGINKWIGNWCIYKMDERLVRLMTVGSNKHDDDSESNDSEESFSATGEELVRFLTNGTKGTQDLPDCEYSPASPECESIRATPDSSPRSPARAWCYACDEEFDVCTCQCPWSPSITYKPCKVCDWEDCKCLKLPIKEKETIEYITLD